jgi:hypothetical protein
MDTQLSNRAEIKLDTSRVQVYGPTSSVGRGETEFACYACHQWAYCASLECYKNTEYL